MKPIVENRRAFRLVVEIATTVESIGQPEIPLDPGLERVYERVSPPHELRGYTLRGVMRDLSENGAFIAAEPLPLLSRVAIRFALAELKVEAIGWILWRRLEDCDLGRSSVLPLILQRGFGVLFESIPLEARLLIHEMVSRANRMAR
jgi:hypothetical protein